jgi:galactose-1-phosphate uridylyltransferase
VAGFEVGTGFYINPVPPEASASHLREVVSGAGESRLADALRGLTPDGVSS